MPEYFQHSNVFYNLLSNTWCCVGAGYLFCALTLLCGDPTLYNITICGSMTTMPENAQNTGESGKGNYTVCTSISVWIWWKLEPQTDKGICTKVNSWSLATGCLCWQLHNTLRPSERLTYALWKDTIACSMINDLSGETFCCKNVW